MTTADQPDQIEISSKTRLLAKSVQETSSSLTQMLAVLQALQTSGTLSDAQNLTLEKLDHLAQDLIKQCSALPTVFADINADTQKQDAAEKVALILVVDDDANLNHFITKALGTKYRVASAYDGQDGYEKALQLHPDLILSDILMPRMRGDELMRAVRSNPELAHIPIILVTAYDEQQERIQWLTEGAQDFLTKPFSFDELIARIANVVTVKRTRDVLQQELASQSQDVTALAAELALRKRQLESALNALQASESRFKRLASANVLGIIVANHDGRIIEANDAFLEMIGYTREELLVGRLDWRELTPSEYHALDDQGLKELVETGVCTPFEKEYFHKQGTRIPVLIGGVLLDKEPLSNVCYVLDMTSIKRTEQAFRETSQKLQALIDGSPLAIMLIDPDGIVRLWSPAAEKTFGWSADDAIGKVLPTMPENRMDEFRRNRERVLNGDNLEGFETRWKKKDGSACEVSIWTSTLPDERGTIQNILTIVTDITERKRSEAALRFLIEGSNVFASTLDYETVLKTLAQFTIPRFADQCLVHILNEDGSLHLVAGTDNPKKEEIFKEVASRYPPDPDAPRGMFHVLKTGKPELYTEITDAQLKGAARDEVHLEMLRALGFKSYIVVPLTARDRILGALSFIIWETERRYTAEDLTLAEVWARRGALALDNARLYGEAQQAIRARDEFLSVAAHELKTPVTSLRGFSQLITRQMKKSGTVDIEQINRSMQVIDEQSIKLAQLVSQLLDISRIQAGRLTLDKKPTDITSLVSALAQTAQNNTTKHSITVHAPEQISLVVDSLRLEQVISNLIDNAIKYSPEGGPIDVEISTPDDQTVRISVTDRGIGIPPEHRHHIFDRFYQAHNTYGGMGLGLFISRQIIEMHNGRIEAEFPAEGGTRFVVSLPRTETD